MHDTGHVRMLQAARGVQRVGDGVFHIERPVAFDDVRKIAAVHELHDEEMPTGGLAGIMRGDDMGMRQAGHGFRFALKAKGASAERSSPCQQFHGDQPLRNADDTP